MARNDRLRELEEKYEGFKVYDNNGESIGKVDDLFVDDADREEYIGVKMGLFGLSGTTLIPTELVRVNEQDRVIEVAESKDRVKDAPHYRDDDEVDHAFEARIREHFGLGDRTGGSYDRPTDASGAEGAATGDNTMRGEDLGTSNEGSREPVGREQYREGETYVSDSSMASAAGGATASGGRSDFETGGREGRGEYGQGEGEGYRQGEAQTGGAGGGQGTGAGAGDDPRYRDAFMEGYRQAIREMSGEGGSSGASTGGGRSGSGEGQGGSGEGQRNSGEREAASEYFGAPTAGPGEKEFDDMQDYQSASTGYQPSRGEGGGGESEGGGEGRTRVRRLRRGS